MIKATSIIENGRWTLLKGSILGIAEDKGVPQNAKAVRFGLPLDDRGVLLENVELGECSPSFAGALVMNQSINGWTDWKDKDGNPVDIYRKKNDD